MKGKRNEKKMKLTYSKKLQSRTLKEKENETKKKNAKKTKKVLIVNWLYHVIQ